MTSATMRSKIDGARRSLSSAGDQISKIGGAEVGSLESINAITQALIEIRESLFWVVDALDASEKAISLGTAVKP